MMPSPSYLVSLHCCLRTFPSNRDLRCSLGWPVLLDHIYRRIVQSSLKSLVKALGTLDRDLIHSTIKLRSFLMQAYAARFQIQPWRGRYMLSKPLNTLKYQRRTVGIERLLLKRHSVHTN
jgi:hypothetical protein